MVTDSIDVGSVMLSLAELHVAGFSLLVQLIHLPMFQTSCIRQLAKLETMPESFRKSGSLVELPSSRTLKLSTRTLMHGRSPRKQKRGQETQTSQDPTPPPPPPPQPEPRKKPGWSSNSGRPPKLGASRSWRLQGLGLTLKASLEQVRLERPNLSAPFLSFCLV